MEEVLNLLDYGFSVAIALYLLMRMERKLESLTEAITALSEKQH